MLLPGRWAEAAMRRSPLMRRWNEQVWRSRSSTRNLPRRLYARDRLPAHVLANSSAVGSATWRGQRSVTAYRVCPTSEAASPASAAGLSSNRFNFGEFGHDLSPACGHYNGTRPDASGIIFACHCRPRARPTTCSSAMSRATCCPRRFPAGRHGQLMRRSPPRPWGHRRGGHILRGGQDLSASRCLAGLPAAFRRAHHDL